MESKAKIVMDEQLEALVQERTCELQKAYSLLERVDKAKADFITAAAHELRTPLTLIRGYAGMLEPLLTEMPDAHVMVEGIITGESRLFEVVNSLLDASRIENEVLTIRKEPVSLSIVLGQVCAEFALAIKERMLTLILTGVDNLPLIECDPDLVYQVFSQLLINAIKYTPDNGTITIQGEVLPDGKSRCAGAPAVQISVADTGIGIDAANRELIFEKFFQTGQVQFHSSNNTCFKAGGMGLGLATARGIVALHGGSIWVESAGFNEQTLPGSTFYVQLPLTIPPSSSSS